MNIFFIGIILFILSGFVAALFNEKFKVFILAFFNAIASVLCVIPAVQVLAGNNSLIKTFNFNEIFGAVNFQIDYLSAFFILIICVMSLISVTYSKGYLKSYVGKNINSHIMFYPLLTASMLAVVTCQNALMFLICWEIMSLSSFFLVIFENEKKEVLREGIKYLVFMHISVIFIMIAFAIISFKAGSFDFSSFANIFENDKHLANIIFGLFFVGFGTKSGFVPFHNWLPDAHPAAPSHVSAVMSGVMIKTGLYGILRVISLIGTPSKSIAFIVLVISLLTALYGVLYAITQNDIKRLLAYSSIENIGIIGIGISIGMLGQAFSNPLVALLGYAGGILHILNHSVFKELLFLSAGSVYIKTHTRNIEKMGGLIKSMPKTGMLFLVASIAICGLPPFNGFVSEFLIYIGMFNGLAIKNFFALIILLFAIASLAFVGTMALICFTKAFSIMFLGMERCEHQVKSDNGKTMILPMTVLALLILFIGVFPDYAFEFLNKPVSIILGNVSPDGLCNIIHVMKILADVVFVLFTVIVLATSLKLRLTKGKFELHETWGCGYNRANNRMQYTGSSYVSPFVSMLTPLFKRVFDIEKPRKLFPESSHFKLEIEDIEEAYIINPLVKYDEWFLSKFEALQSGNIQSYIKYGLIFLVIVLIGSFFVG